MAGQPERRPVARGGPDGEVDMTIEARSRQDPRPADATPGGLREPARPGGGQRRTIVTAVELTALARHLASRRFTIQVITGAIALAAAAELLRENQARNRARFTAWIKKLHQRQ
jgi:hypothetical protein